MTAWLMYIYSSAKISFEATRLHHPLFSVATDICSCSKEQIWEFDANDRFCSRKFTTCFAIAVFSLRQKFPAAKLILSTQICLLFNYYYYYYYYFCCSSSHCKIHVFSSCNFCFMAWPIMIEFVIACVWLIHPDLNVMVDWTLIINYICMLAPAPLPINIGLIGR